MAGRPRASRSAPPAAHPAVVASGLGRRFGRRWALARIELTVPAGEALLVAGPNGSGKTTLLRLIAGLCRPTRGHLEVFGHSWPRERLAWRRSVSMLGHDTYLYPGLTALETARLWARLVGRPASDHDLSSWLARVGLEGCRNRQVADFSAGMRKRLAWLRIQLEAPRLVLLDEPYAALDAIGQRWLESWIADCRVAGRTMIIASHAVERCARLCDRAVLLHRGQLAWQGPAGRVVERMEAPAWAA